MGFDPKKRPVWDSNTRTIVTGSVAAGGKVTLKAESGEDDPSSLTYYIGESAFYVNLAAASGTNVIWGLTNSTTAFSGWGASDGAVLFGDKVATKTNVQFRIVSSTQVCVHNTHSTNAGTLYITTHANSSSAIPVIESASSDVTSGSAPLMVTFSSTFRGDVDTIAWDFGDGESSSIEDPTHRYISAGTYTPTITIYGPGGFDKLTLTDIVIS